MVKRFDIKLSENFLLSEFIRSETATLWRIDDQFIINDEIYQNINNLVLYVLQPLRYAVGKIVISSGYRCAKLNKIVNGAQNSDHMKGMAADFYVDDIDLAVAFLKTRIFDQMIIYDNFIHISYAAPRLRKQIIDKRI